MSQAERVFYILDLLMDKGRFRTDEVASYFEISEKQVWRDKEYLTDRCPLSCGNLDIIFDRAIHAYRLTEESLSRLTVWRAESSLSLSKDQNDGKSSSSSSYIVSSDADYITYKSYASEGFSPFVYNTLMSALKKKKQIRISYSSAKKKSVRILDPLRLVNYAEIWYLIAAEDSMILTFSLSRIDDISLLESSIKFNDKEKLNEVLNGYGIYSGKEGEMVRNYTIRFYSWAIPVVSGQIWHKEQRVKILEDGKVLEMSLPVSNHTELLSRILFYGDAAEPMAPEDFVSEYREKCKKMAERYERV